MYGDQFGEFVCGYWDLGVKSLTVILLQIVMVSPGTHLEKNHECQSRTIESQTVQKATSPWVFM